MQEIRKFSQSNAKIFSIALGFLLGVTLFFPRINVLSPTLEIRSLVSSFTLGIFFLYLLTFKTAIFNGISVNTILVSFSFSGYLLIHSIIFDNLKYSLVGNSNRNLGIITYLTCSGFFILGSILRKLNPNGIIHILFFLALLQIIVFSTKFFGSNSSYRDGSFFNSNPVSILVGILSIGILTWILESEINQKKLVFTILIFLTSITLFWIGSFQSEIAMVISLAIYLFLKYQRKLEYQASISSIAFVVVATIFFLIVLLLPMPTLDQSNSNSFHERLEIYKTSLKTILQNPIFGLGIDHFNLSYFKLNSYQNLKLVDNAHSVPFQTVATVGLLGAVIFYGLIIRVLNLSSKKDSPYDITARNIIIFYLVTSLFAIQTPGIESLLFFTLGFLINEKSKTVSNTNWPLIKKSVLIIGNLISLVLILNLISSTLKLSHDLLENPIKSQNQALQIERKLQNVANLDLLLTTCKFALAINDRPLGYKVIKRMLDVSNVDQRSIACVILQAEQYSDENLQKVGVQLTKQARK